MDNHTRRDKILNIIQTSSTPVSATALSKEMGVSRQVIVGDVALLRAEGNDILSTPRGYVAAPKEKSVTKRIAVNHSAEDTQLELYTLVDAGCTVEDVIVEHPIYGQLIGGLRISSRYDVDEFIRKSKEENATPLSALTEGIHLHTLSANSEEQISMAIDKLKELGILL
ncbi:hypothetical protein SAMN02910369_01213 [Lachnospiraceae bacterium NE2001]|nr:hypothetical protein SAMN02910369_01213 [Lachnospiraceae bacterium NE2001]